MKAKRQALIREIVESQSIQTQEELAEALRSAREWYGPCFAWPVLDPPGTAKLQLGMRRLLRNVLAAVKHRVALFDEGPQALSAVLGVVAGLRDS